jgi:hypothetical protein
MAVPLFLGAEFLGIVGGCGLLHENREVESFLNHKMASVDIEEIENL